MFKIKRFSKADYFLSSCLGFIFGVALASFLPAGVIPHDLIWFVCLAGFFVFLLLFWPKPLFRLIFFISFFLFLGIWRYSICLPADSPDKIWHYNGGSVAAEGLVVEEPEKGEKSTKIKIGIKKIFRDNKIIYTSGHLLATVGRYPEYRYGDYLKIDCADLSAPEKINNFFYDRYLARYDIYSVCYYPKITVLEKNRGNRFYSLIFSIKERVRELTGRGLGEPAAGIVRGTVIGDTKSMSADIKQLFSHVGISHMIAISGTHITMIAAIIMNAVISLGLNRHKAFYLVVFLLAVYILLIGLPASALRAGLMSFLVLLALKIGRLNRLTNSLFLAGAALLLVNPRLLRDDIGFQLSFLALLAILYVYPIINQSTDFGFFSNAPRWVKAAKETIIITLAVQILVSPITVVDFSLFSLIAPLANILVLWTFPVLFLGSLLALVLSLVLPSLVAVFFLPVKITIDYIIFISKMMEKIPGSYWQTDYIWPGWITVYYIFLAVLFYLIQKGKRQKNLQKNHILCYDIKRN